MNMHRTRWMSEAPNGMVWASLALLAVLAWTHAAMATLVVNSAKLNTVSLVDGTVAVTVAPGATVNATVNVTTSSTAWRTTSWSTSGGTSGCADTTDQTVDGTFDSNVFTITAPAAAGVYDVTFSAKSNASCGGGSPSPDKVFVGVLQVCTTPAAPTSPTATPATVCSGASSTLSATVPSGVTVDWFTVSCGGTAVSGGASPSVSPTATTTYFARARNTTSGCASFVSATCASVTVTVIALPANPGSITATSPVCSNSTGNTASVAAQSGITHLWSISNGTITSSTSGDSITYTAGASGTVTLTVQSRDNTTLCLSASTSSANVTINQPPTTATVGGAQTICTSGTTGELGGNTPSVGSGAWSVVSGGTGTFNPNNTTANATFTHSTGPGPVVVRWTISNSPCTASTADVTITINQPPTTATVGGAQTICTSGTTAGLGGNTPSVGTGAWSVVSGGTGTFNPNNTTANATFTHLTGTGPIVVRWTISNSPCTASSADVTITINQPPTTATVGGAQTICSGGTTAGLGGNTPSVGTGAWSVVSGGTGTFNPSNATPNATFTHSTGAGPVVVRWTISNAPCTASSADVTITITQPPLTDRTVSPASTTVCPGNTVAVTIGASETGVTYQLYDGANPSGASGAGNGGNLVLTSAALNASTTLTVQATRVPCAAVTLTNSVAVTVEDVTPPTISGCPANISVHSDAGHCDAEVSWTAPTAMDNCVVASFMSNHSPGDVFAIGTTTVTYTAMDAAGNSATCSFSVTVDAYNELLADVELSPTLSDPNPGSPGDTLTRCITFEFWNCPNDTSPSATVNQTVAFPVDGAPHLTSGVSVLVPCGSYTCMTARDRLHTLRSTVTLGFDITGKKYAGALSGRRADEPGGGTGHRLVGGNLNDDTYIDIIDFGIWVNRYGTSYGTGNTNCMTASYHADISGDGLVGTGDYSFIQINFFLADEANCCGAPDLTAGNGPITDIAVTDLAKLGLAALASADLNGDGRLNQLDIAAYLGGTPLPSAGGPNSSPSSARKQARGSSTTRLGSGGR